MWNRIIALVLKEFLALLKDPKSRAVIIVPPIVQLIVFGYAATFDVMDIPIAIYNEDRGQAARDMVARFENSPHFHFVAEISHDAQIAPLIDRREVLMVLRIRQRFSHDIHNGTAPVQAIIDGRESNTAVIVLNYARQIVDGFNKVWSQTRGLSPLPAHLQTRSWFNPNLLSQWFIVPGIVGLLSLVVTMLVTALSVAREREQGTFDQLLVAPYRPFEILAGKALPGFVIGLAEATVIILVAVFWFHVPLLGSLAALYAGIVLFLLSAIGVGLMISSLSTTQQQGLLGAFMFLVPAIVLSGFATPIANMTPVVQKLTLINPMRYFLVVLRGAFLEGATLGLLVDQLWPMALIGMVTLTVAAWLFRRRIV